MILRRDIGPRRSVAIAAMLACSSGATWAQVTISGSHTGTVQLDGLTNPGGGSTATVLSGATVDSSSGPALQGQNLI